MSATIKDVARISGVSISTVSRVLSDSPRISDSTKRKVMDAVHELHYHPNAIARSLVGGSTLTLALIISAAPEMLSANPFFIRAVVGISTCARESGYNLMLDFASDESSQMECIKRHITSKNVDGIILFANRESDRCVAHLKNCRFPFSMIGEPDDESSCLWVDNDNRQASFNAANYLIGKGHRKIGYLCGPAGYHISTNRLLGYKKALESAGIAFDEQYVTYNVDFSIEAGYEAAGKMLERLGTERYPTAVMTCDDMQAVGVLNYLNKAHIKSISLIGFNNISMTEYTKPPITSVDVKPEILGKYAAKMLIDFLNSDCETFGHYIVGSTIVERDSVSSI